MEEWRGGRGVAFGGGSRDEVDRFLPSVRYSSCDF